MQNAQFYSKHMACDIIQKSGYCNGMRRNDFFICKRCGVESIKSPLHRDSMCDPCSRADYAEQVQKLLEVLPAGAGKKYFLYVLGVDVSDYDTPVVADDYPISRLR